MSSRLPQEGSRINREKTVDFRFNGKNLKGFYGDTVASALLANNEMFVARSFKYHRPRGIFSAGEEEPNALMGIGEGSFFEPNIKATLIEKTTHTTMQLNPRRGCPTWKNHDQRGSFS